MPPQVFTVKAAPNFLTAQRGASRRAVDGVDRYFGIPPARCASPKSFGSGFIAFVYTKLGNKQYVIAGTTKDSAGAVLGGCTVKLYTATDSVLQAVATSDDTTGAYSFLVPSNGWTYFVTAYKAGSPDVAGTSVNTLVGA